MFPELSQRLPPLDRRHVSTSTSTSPTSFGALWALTGISDCVMPQNRTHRGGGGTASSDDGDEGHTGDIEPEGSEGLSGPAAAAGGKHDLGPSSVTLSGLLNAIDGVASQASPFSFISLYRFGWSDWVIGGLCLVCVYQLPEQA